MSLLTSSELQSAVLATGPAAGTSDTSSVVGTGDYVLATLNSRTYSVQSFLGKIRELEEEGARVKGRIDSELENYGTFSLTSSFESSPRSTEAAGRTGMADTQNPDDAKLAEFGEEDHPTLSPGDDYSHLIQDSGMSVFSSVPTAPSTPASLVGTGNHQAAARSLVDSQAEISRLKGKIREANAICEKQRRHYRRGIETMQNTLEKTVVGRESIYNMRREDAATQEKLISDLQEVLNDLQSTNDAKERALAESGRKVALLQQEAGAAGGALREVRLLVSGEERRRGRRFHDASSSPAAPRQSPAALVLSLRACMQEHADDVKRLEAQVSQTQEEVGDVKRSALEHEQRQHSEGKARLQKLAADHGRQVGAATERADNARKQAASLQAQMGVAAKHHREELARKTKETLGLREKLSEKEKALASLKKACEEKVARLEVDERQKMTVAVGRLTGQLNAFNEKYYELAHEMETKQAEVGKLLQALGDVKRDLLESQSILQMERTSRRDLTREDAAVALARLREDLQEKEEELGRLRQRLSEAMREVAGKTSAAELARQESSVAMNKLETECKVLRKDRDRLGQQSEERLGEISSLRVRLLEMERTLAKLDAADSSDAVADDEADVRVGGVGRSGFTPTGRFAKTRDTARKLGLAGKRVEELESMNRELKTNLGDKDESLSQATAERESLKRDLTDAREKVEGLSNEKDTLWRLLSSRDGPTEQEVSILKEKLTLMENDLQLARKALSVQQRLQETAAKMDTRQRDVDTLHNQLRAAAKEKQRLAEEKEGVTALLDRVMEKTESACIQLQHSLSQVQDYRIHIARLETALEKAAMKYALVQLGAERQQQQQQQEEDKQLTRLLRRQPPGRTAAPAAGLSKSLTTERDRGGVTIIRAARSPPTPTAQKLAATDRKTGSVRSGGNSPRGATLERCSDQRQQEDDTPRFLSADADADDGWEVKNDIVLLMEELRQLIAQGRRLTRVSNGSAAAEQQQEESGWVSGGLRGSPTGGETQQRERREANGTRREGASPASERARRRSNEASETSSDPWRETLLSRDLNSTGTSSGVIANNRLQAYIHRHDERRASTPKKAARW